MPNESLLGLGDLISVPRRVAEAGEKMLKSCQRLAHACQWKRAGQVDVTAIGAIPAPGLVPDDAVALADAPVASPEQQGVRAT